MAKFVDFDAEMSGDDHEDDYDENSDEEGSLKNFVVGDEEEDEDGDEEDVPEPELTVEEQKVEEARKIMIRSEKKRRQKLDLERERLELLRDDIEEKQKKLEKLRGRGGGRNVRPRRSHQLNEGSEEDNSSDESMLDKKIPDRSLQAPLLRPPTPPTTTRVQVPAAVVARVVAAAPSPQIRNFGNLAVNVIAPSAPPSLSSPSGIFSPRPVGTKGSVPMPPSRNRMTDFRPDEAPPQVTDKEKWSWFNADGGKKGVPLAQPDASNRRGTGYVFVKGTLCRHKDGVVQPSTGVDY